MPIKLNGIPKATTLLGFNARILTGVDIGLLI